MDFWAYVLECSDGAFYVGHSDQIEVRLAQHQAGQGGSFTAQRRPVRLVWSARFDSRDAAFACERQLKGWSRVKKLALIRGEFELLPELSRNRQRGDDNPPSTGSG